MLSAPGTFATPSNDNQILGTITDLMNHRRHETKLNSKMEWHLQLPPLQLPAAVYSYVAKEKTNNSHTLEKQFGTLLDVDEDRGLLLIELSAVAKPISGEDGLAKKTKISDADWNSWRTMQHHMLISSFGKDKRLELNLNAETPEHSRASFQPTLEFVILGSGFSSSLVTLPA